MGRSGGATTDIYIFEISSSTGDIGVAGSSDDSTLVSTAGAQFVGLFKNPGFNFTWIDQLSISSTQKVKDI